MGALTSPLKSGLSGGGQRGGQGHVGEGSVRPTRCELPPLLGVALQPLRPSRLLYQQLGQRSSGWGERELPFSAPPNRALTRIPLYSYRRVGHGRLRAKLQNMCEPAPTPLKESGAECRARRPHLAGRGERAP